VQRAASALLGSASAAFATLIALSGIDPGLADLQAALVITNTAPTIADAVTSFMQNYTKAVVASWAPFDETQSSRGPQPVNDPSYGLSTLAGWGDDLAAVPQNGSPDAAQMQANQAALVALVQGCAVTAYARLSAQASYSSQEDAEAARDAITGLIEAQATTAADSGNDATFAQWRALSQAVSSDLTTRGKQVPNVVDYTFQNNRTALELAQLLYQDGTRAGELVARNAAPFPLFMPATVEALAS